MGMLSGMTGFARSSGESAGTSWTWKIRSVNGKGLDIRTRLPNDFTALEPVIKKELGRHITRGNVQVALTVMTLDGGTTYQINEALFDEISTFLRSKKGLPKLNQIIQVPGVVEPAQARLSDTDKGALEAAMAQSFGEAARTLKLARDGEGAAMLAFLTGAVDKVAKLIAEAESLAATQPETIFAKVQEKLTALLGENLSADRLAQEAANMALKADVREETDRLQAHVAQARDLLAKGSPVGRKLDFLAQEFNREVNTLCSKSADIDLTQVGLALKSAVEQFREQAANVE